MQCCTVPMVMVKDEAGTYQICPICGRIVFVRVRTIPYGELVEESDETKNV